MAKSCVMHGNAVIGKLTLSSTKTWILSRTYLDNKRRANENDGFKMTALEMSMNSFKPKDVFEKDNDEQCL